VRRSQPCPNPNPIRNIDNVEEKKYAPNIKMAIQRGEIVEHKTTKECRSDGLPSKGVSNPAHDSHRSSSFAREKNETCISQPLIQASHSIPE
jgi:hypothetical protein